VESDRPQMTTRRLCFAWCITKATDTLSEWVILIAFPRQQWLRERALVLRYTYLSCPVLFCTIQCPVCRIPERDSCHKMSWLVKAFIVKKVVVLVDTIKGTPCISRDVSELVIIRYGIVMTE
jgi:hypothetical protein